MLERAVRKSYLCTAVEDEMHATYQDYTKRTLPPTLFMNIRNHLSLHLNLKKMKKAPLNTYK